MSVPTPKTRRVADRKIPIQASVPQSVIRRLDWLIEHMQTTDPSVCRSHIVSQFLVEKLNENSVPLIDL